MPGGMVKNDHMQQNHDREVIRFASYWGGGRGEGVYK